ncbi:ROK family transcriptional regulator [Tenggerimyces flavus]|uniref:ROK family protein n=1 Tax=Tenggerimyces flavus TaxID=1708749 RepID=A0ABV7Y748_9ACTN|nr:ROK family transcriptional regulator [Tenggerimyces flavus]MBM7785070.1 putative NBD/HSP70 family sugar kinase [Tenggerimyces flavus]
MSTEAPRRVPGSGPAAVRVFTTVLTDGPVSRVDVARLTGLSPAAVTKAVRPLLDAGYLVEGELEDRPASVGRPANPLEVDADREFFVGIKATADELVGVVTDLRAVVRRAKHVRLRDHDVDHVVDAIAKLTKDLLSTDRAFQRRTTGLGLAIAGDVDHHAGVARYSPFLDWQNVPIARLVRKATGLETFVENDVKALTRAEQWFGHGVGSHSFALVTIGAGIGCGLVADGQLVEGAHDVAGELGHVTVDLNGAECMCGGRGCVETVASERAIVEHLRSATGEPELTLTAALARARTGDAATQRVFREAGRAIGVALATVANLVGPERIVVSGEGLPTYELVEEQIREEFGRQAYGAARCDVITREMPFEEWARGAAAVAIGQLLAAERL